MDSAWIPFGFRQKVTFLLTSFLHRSKITLIKGSSFHLRMRQTLRAEAEIIIVITLQGRLLLVSNETFINHFFDVVKGFFCIKINKCFFCRRKGLNMEYLLLLIGFVLLIKGADFFVDGSSSLARIMKVPSVIIGLTIVAMGTSAPEASVSVNAALAGSNDIAISNVIGSNLFNGLVVVGVCAFMAGFKTNPEILKRDMPLNIIVTAILCIMLLDRHINHIEGIILLISMAVYIAVMVISALKNRETADECKILSLPKSLIFIIGGLISVIFGGTLVVDNACLIAKDFGVSENFIGLTIIAIGTSLPELVTSITATRKGDSGLALGNAIGSNLFNILFILGMSATICPLNVLSESIIDCIILLVSAVILYVFARTKKTMNRWEGIVCVFLYVGYTAYLLIR